jgi:HD-like signal output (HDOD) protein
MLAARRASASPMPNPVTDQELATALEALPPVSPVLQRLLFVLDDPHSDLDDISKLVRTDAGLSTKMLRLANSAHFGLPFRVATIEEAIQQIGVLEVSRLVSALGSRPLFERPLDCYGITAALFWQHTLAVAVAAEVIAAKTSSDRASAYSVGMLHAIGFVALDRIALGRKLAARETAVPLLDWERENFGTDNPGAAARVLRHWKFPEALATAVAARYEPPAAELSPDTTTGAILHIASCLAEKVHAGLPAEGGLFRLSPERAAPFGLSADDLGALEDEVRQNLARTRTLLKLA